MTALSGSAQRVQDALTAHGLDCRVLELPTSTRTALEAAAAVGCEVAQIVKSLIFKTQSGQPVLVVASGSNRVDETKISALVGEPIGKADAAFVRQTTGFAIGGVAPVGHLQPIQTLIDEDLFNYSTLWAAAGTPNAVFALTPTDLQQLTAGQTATVKAI